MGITGKVNCKNIRHDSIGFDRVLNLTGTEEKQGFVYNTIQEMWGRWETPLQRETGLHIYAKLPGV